MNKSNFNIQGSICKGLEKGFIFIQGIIISLYASIIFFILWARVLKYYQNTFSLIKTKSTHKKTEQVLKNPPNNKHLVRKAVLFQIS